jgi:hypothetical protein
MRKAILLGVASVFMLSGAAFAEGKGGCGWGSLTTASGDTKSQTVATDATTTTTTTATKEPKS